eukprot:TRINITY_DN110770_c0_g1_i1.p1 TRINITY_DN110770_c0_g1~~TRINITY_DN110770_c0_g1_i1.p1  ORF type:complete len:223 (+),score=74.98 TRINITY_DN110770_c0_g1_i1:248-916(+)
MVRLRAFLLLPLLLAQVDASLLAKKASPTAEKPAPPAVKPCGQFCVEGQIAGEQQPQETTQKPAAAPAAGKAAVVSDATTPQATEAADECLCDVEGDKCTCNAACDRRQEVAICAALLGPCICEDNGRSMCACQGHCPAMGDLMHACQSAQGCMWDGYFCNAEKAAKKPQAATPIKKVAEETVAAKVVEDSLAAKAFKLPRVVQAACAIVAAAVAIFVLLHL